MILLYLTLGRCVLSLASSYRHIRHRKLRLAFDVTSCAVSQARTSPARDEPLSEKSCLLSNTSPAIAQRIHPHTGRRSKHTAFHPPEWDARNTGDSSLLASAILTDRKAVFSCLSAPAAGNRLHRIITHQHGLACLFGASYGLCCLFKHILVAFQGEDAISCRVSAGRLK